MLWYVVRAFLVNCLLFSIDENSMNWSLIMVPNAIRRGMLPGIILAMRFCQLAQAKSLREIYAGLACCIGKLRHLGMKDAPNKSTLSYANAHRPWEMYRDLFYETLDFCKKGLRTNTSSASRRSCFPWIAQPYLFAYLCSPGAKFRRTKGAVKLHLLLDHD